MTQKFFTGYPDGRSVPTIVLSRPYRVFYYSGDGYENFHVHVRRDNIAYLGGRFSAPGTTDAAN